MGIDLEKRFERVGKKIKARRKKLGFGTQAKLAKAVGTDATRVSRWESGKESPRAYLEKLLEVLEVDHAWFEAAGEEPPPPEPNAEAIFTYVKRIEQELAKARAELDRLRNPDFSDPKKQLVALIPLISDDLANDFLLTVEDELAVADNETKDPSGTRS